MLNGSDFKWQRNLIFLSLVDIFYCPISCSLFLLNHLRRLPSFPLYFFINRPSFLPGSGDDLSHHSHFKGVVAHDVRLPDRRLEGVHVESLALL
jgi:hypothetical protein